MRDVTVEILKVRDHGQTYKAFYYVEDGVIHADLAGKLQATICLGVPAADIVRALLTERILQMSVQRVH
ncbi:MAG: hypothetical protein JWR51_1548 [Devosia sp.]|uniref:hypothetical protein n=1 Tax=Devosia sp. TaxID=1871048 RepID=UPI0026371A91|nr:hypothetical protein [Devosia sp.]MDB5528445.1 hypothetical protein [Devosia sp.]